MCLLDPYSEMGMLGTTCLCAPPEASYSRHDNGGPSNDTGCELLQVPRHQEHERLAEKTLYPQTIKFSLTACTTQTQLLVLSNYLIYTLPGDVHMSPLGQS